MEQLLIGSFGSTTSPSTSTILSLLIEFMKPIIPNDVFSSLTAATAYIVENYSLNQ